MNAFSCSFLLLRSLVRSLLLPLGAAPCLVLSLLLAGCGGGETAAPAAPGGSTTAGSSANGSGASGPTPATPAGNWARLRDFSVTPAVLRAPATGAEVLNLRLDYWPEFVSDTFLPTFWLFGQLLPKGEALLAPEQPFNRLIAQACGQQAYACGEPHSPLCTVSMGWLDPAKRRINCGSGDPALEVPPGQYVFHASTCYFDAKGTRVCNTIARELTLQ